MKGLTLICLTFILCLSSCIRWDLEKFPLNTFSNHFPVFPAPDALTAQQFVQLSDGSFRILGTDTKQQILLLRVSADGKEATPTPSPGAGKGLDIQNGVGKNAFGTLVSLREGLVLLQYADGVQAKVRTDLSQELAKKFPLIDSLSGANCIQSPSGNWVVTGLMKQATQPNRLFVGAMRPGGTTEWVHSFDIQLIPVAAFFSPSGNFFLLAKGINENAVLLRFQPNGVLSLSRPLNQIFIQQEAGITGDGKSLVITAAQRSAKGYRTLVTSVSENGDRIWEYNRESTLGVSTGIGIIRDSDGQIIILAREGTMNSEKYAHKLFKLNQTGEFIWENTFTPGKSGEQLVDLIPANDFGYVLLGTDPTGFRVIKTDVLGKFQP